MEWWQWSIGVLIAGAGVLSPIVLAAMARDRTIMAMIQSGKDDTRKIMTDATGELHDRISRVQKDYVRRDDLDGHLARIDKRFDEIRQDQRQHAEENKSDLRELKQMMNSLMGRLVNDS